jgi:hypothetical protein
MALDAKYLYRRLDALLAGVDPKRSQARVLESFLEDSFKALSGELRLRAGLLYAEGRDAFVLKKTVGEPGGDVADTLSPTGPPLSLLFKHRVYIFGEPEDETSPAKLASSRAPPPLPPRGPTSSGTPLLPPRRRLGARGAGLHPQHRAPPWARA